MKHIILFADSVTLPQYQHIAIFKQHDESSYLMLDFMARGNISVDTVSVKLVERLCKRYQWVEIADLPTFTPWRTGTLLSISCVSLAKAYLGIKASYVITPCDLHEYLIDKKMSWVKKLLSPFRWFCLYLGFVFKSH